jgi:hypothetical protein
MSLTKVSYSMIEGASVNVLDFGADPTGVADSTVAIQAAVNANNGFCSIYFPSGTYKVTSTITFAYDRYFVYGDGVASRINFMPTANDICFLFQKFDNARSTQQTIRDLAFYSDDTTYDKTAISIVDIVSSLLENIQTLFPHWSGGSNYSTFLHVQGRDSTAVRGLNVQADVPIRISPIPSPHVAAGIGIDHFHFSDCYLICSKTTKSCVQIDTGVELTHTTFDGYQAWVGGEYGLYWNDTTNTLVSIALTIKNVRWEQQPGTTGWLFYISHNVGLDQFNAENCYGASATNGIYFSKVTRWSLKQIDYIGTQIGLSVDSGSDYGSFDNVFFNDPSATVNLNGEYLTGTYWIGGNAYTFLPAAAGGVAQSINRNAVGTFNQITSPTITVAAGATFVICQPTFTGMLNIVSGAAVAAIYYIKGGFNSTVIMSFSDAGFWGTAAGSASFNIYYNAGTSQYLLQNNTASSATFRATAFI